MSISSVGGQVDRQDGKSFQAYRFPADKKAYLPDPTEPVDRWLQADNASNARTTIEIARDLQFATIAGVIDPFTGGGSTAAAARLMGLPFFGVEKDPVLACASLAKTASTPDHVRLLGHYLDLWHPDEPEQILRAISVDLAPADALVVSCLALVWFQRANAGAPLPIEDMIQDLKTSSAPRPNSRVIWGDSTKASTWAALDPPPGHVLIYTSPPFGVTSPRLAAPSWIETAAGRILRPGGWADPATADPATEDALGLVEPSTFPAYERITLEMLRQAVTTLDRATVIMEHEPADNGDDVRWLVFDKIKQQLGDAVRNIRILESQKFSWRGALSFIVCELHP